LEKILGNVLRTKIVGRLVAGGIGEAGDAVTNRLMIRKARAIGKRLAASLHD
jgi:hypothetical protein